MWERALPFEQTSEHSLTISYIPVANLSFSQTAFFLDFDGTLAEIIADPARVSITRQTRIALGRLQEAAGGAVAVISGRSIAQLDVMLGPLRLPAAGVHGIERRNAAGTMMREAVERAAEQRLAFLVNTFVEDRKGLLAEVKPGSVALHYRNRPEMMADCRAFAEGLAQNNHRISLVEGRKVIEMKLSARTKGDAIADFMMEAPFRNRRPFFAGDDITDETGFALVNAMGGISLKIGPGTTVARYRVEDRQTFAAWLESLA